MKKSTFKSWERYKGTPELAKASAAIMDLVGSCKTERELIRELVRRLQGLGARALGDCDEVSPGQLVYLNWKGRALAVAKIGRQPAALGVNVIASHGDAPRVDLKERPLYEKDNLGLLDCHYYGGIKKYQWTNVPLALHGEVYDGVSERHLVIGEDPSDPLLVIPDLEPHLDRELTKRSAAEAVTGEDLDAIAGSCPAAEGSDGLEILAPLKALLKDRYGLSDLALASADLSLVPAGPAREVGLDRAMIGAYGLDDRVCTALSWQALLDLQETPERTAVMMVFDKEEIGSDGLGGADGALTENFFAELLRLQGEGASVGEIWAAMGRSVAISADVTSGRNPLYGKHYVRDQQALVGNGVVVVKFTGSGGKYAASEARGQCVAALLAILEEGGVPWQVGSFGIVDKSGGGTLAKFLARRGMDVVDLGPALISMHSPLELVSKADGAAVWDCFRLFWQHMAGLP